MTTAKQDICKTVWQKGHLKVDNVVNWLPTIDDYTRLTYDGDAYFVAPCMTTNLNSNKIWCNYLYYLPTDDRYVKIDLLNHAFKPYVD